MKEWPYYVNKTRICTLARKPRTHVPIFFFGVSKFTYLVMEMKSFHFFRANKNRDWE